MKQQRLILIVDSSDARRALLRGVLEPDYAVHDVADDIAALAFLVEQHERVSALLLAIELAQLDGGILTALRTDLRFSGIPMIVTACMHEKRAEIYALELGAADFVTDACHPQVLRLRLANAICSREDMMKSHLMQQKLMEAAQRDAMTGLLNRTAFETAVERELVQACDACAAFIMLDLDNFKQINDTGGHIKGDHVLRQVAALLLETIRVDDFMARLGGDEFAVFMRRIPSTHVAVERTRCFCDSVRGAFGGRKISCSAGVALYPEHGTNFAALYKCADEALYEAKRRGKDQSVVAGSTVCRTDADAAVGGSPSGNR